MVDEIKSWERQTDEPSRWFQWFERFRLAGPGRSLSGVCNAWRYEQGRQKSKDAPKSWRDAAVHFHWRERAEAWDKYISDLAATAAEANRLATLTTGYALQHERLRSLNALADLLLEELKTEDKRWLPDVKGIGSGRDGTFERVDLVHFNAAIIEQFRETLADIAEEMGERIHKHELTGADGGPVETVVKIVKGVSLEDL